MIKYSSELPRSFLLILLFSLTAHFPLLLNQGVYWDGWTWINMILSKDYASLHDFLGQAGLQSVGIYYSFFTFFKNPVLAFKIVVFASTTVTSLVLFILMRHYRLGTPVSRLVGATLSVTLPAYFVAPEMSVSQYSFFLALFATAFLFNLISTGLKPSFAKGLLQAGSLLLFYISFSMNSLVVLYFLFLMHLLARDKAFFPPHLKCLPKFTGFLRKNFLYVLTPVIFWILRPKAQGIYAGYNEIRLSRLINYQNYSLFLKAQAENMVHPFLVAFSGIESTLVFLLFCAILYRLLAANPTVQKNRKAFLSEVGLGFVFVTLSLLPYFLVGKMPLIEDWESRHGLILSFAIGLCAAVILGFIELKTKSRVFMRVIYSALTCVFIMQSFSGYKAWDMDWYKQSGIVYGLQDLPPDVATSRNWVFTDKAQNWNALNRKYRFYEMTGMLLNAFGNQKRKGSLSGDLNPSSLFKTQAEQRGYLMCEYLDSPEAARPCLNEPLPEFKNPVSFETEADAPDLNVEVTASGEAQIVTMPYPQLKYLEYFHPELLKAEIKKWIILNVRPN